MAHSQAQNTPQLISINSQTIQDLFPQTPSGLQVQYFFHVHHALPPPNPFLAILPAHAALGPRRNHTLAHTRMYATNIITGDFVDTKEDTKRRADIEFLIKHDTQVNVANHNNILFRVVSRECGSGSIWSRAGRFAQRRSHDSKRDWTDCSNNVLEELINQTGLEVWRQMQNTPGLIVTIMLFWLREVSAFTWQKVRYLLGGQSGRAALGGSLDVEALYDAHINGLDSIVMNDQQLVAELVEYLELSCAHLLTEVLKNYRRVNPSTTRSKAMAASNFKLIAARWPNMANLRGQEHLFPAI